MRSLGKEIEAKEPTEDEDQLPKTAFHNPTRITELYWATV